MMITPEALNALADRVEREEPSRIMDWEVHCAVLGGVGVGSYRTHPAYTTSLDAAVTLMPEGWTAWELRSHGAMTRFSADLSRLTECDAGEDWAHGRGATPAAAFTAAALRAKAAIPTDGAEVSSTKVRTP